MERTAVHCNSAGSELGRALVLTKRIATATVLELSCVLITMKRNATALQGDRAGRPNPGLTVDG
eukprot:6050022-Pyramimonas_sp.AAC.1